MRVLTKLPGGAAARPRIANALLRRTRDFAQIKGNGQIDTEIARICTERAKCG